MIVFRLPTIVRTLFALADMLRAACAVFSRRFIAAAELRCPAGFNFFCLILFARFSRRRNDLFSPCAHTRSPPPQSIGDRQPPLGAAGDILPCRGHHISAESTTILQSVLRHVSSRVLLSLRPSPPWGFCRIACSAGRAFESACRSPKGID